MDPMQLARLWISQGRSGRSSKETELSLQCIKNKARQHKALQILTEWVNENMIFDSLEKNLILQNYNVTLVAMLMENHLRVLGHRFKMNNLEDDFDNLIDIFAELELSFINLKDKRQQTLKDYNKQLEKIKRIAEPTSNQVNTEINNKCTERCIRLIEEKMQKLDGILVEK
jgi:hypothetical protein